MGSRLRGHELHINCRLRKKIKEGGLPSGVHPQHNLAHSKPRAWSAFFDTIRSLLTRYQVSYTRSVLNPEAFPLPPLPTTLRCQPLLLPEPSDVVLGGVDLEQPGLTLCCCHVQRFRLRQLPVDHFAGDDTYLDSILLFLLVKIQSLADFPTV